MTTWKAINKRKHSKLICSYCKVTFSQKFNRDRHVKNIQQEDTLVFVNYVTEADENRFSNLVDFNAEEPYENAETAKSHAFPVSENGNTSQNNNDEILNASFISDTGQVMDVKMCVLFIKFAKMMNSLRKIATMRIQNQQVLYLMILKSK